MTENPIHIVMLEMTQVGVFNGVTRCIQTLSNALCRNKHVRVTWLRIIYGSGYQEQLCHAPVSFHVFRLSISLGSFLTDAPERATCWNLVFNMLSSQFQSQQRVLYHIHTLNLIELATFLRERYSGKIVVHLHCIPWKTVYDRNYKKYHELYNRYYSLKKIKPVEDYMSRHYETLAYQQADAIICVTQCACEFLQKMGIPIEKIHIVYNGIADIVKGDIKHLTSEGKSCVLFVGNSNPSKGLDFLLHALSDFKEETIKLIIVGNFAFQKRVRLLSSYPHIDIQFTGQLSLKDMSYYYSKADIGIIPSVHEQCSYTAIEMMMFGIPVVCTDIDGLREIFQQGINALKVPLLTPLKGKQQVDTKAISKAIHTIINQPSLHERLSRGGRDTYLRHFTEKRMISSINHLYSSLLLQLQK